MLPSNHQIPLFVTPSISNRLGIRPGDKLRAQHELYDHVGTAGYDGFIYAASFKFGKVTKTSLEHFSGGKAVINEGHIGPLSVGEVISRYEAVLNNPYDLLFSNCEHTDNWARGLGWSSEQVGNAVVGSLAGILLGLSLVAVVRR